MPVSTLTGSGRWLAAGAALLTLAGCSPFSSPVPAGRPVREVYEEDSGAPMRATITVLPATPPGVFEKTRPVIYPPKVFAVFVPEHLDIERDMKIGAHWIFMKLRDSSWTEEPIDREPTSSAEVTAEEVARLKKSLSGDRLGRIVVPHESDAKQRTEEKR
jgi:hypothetical protein